MTKEIGIEDAKLNVSFCINGQVYLVAMEKEHLKAVEFLVKKAADTVIKTDRTQLELLQFLGLEE